MPAPFGWNQRTRRRAVLPIAAPASGLAIERVKRLSDSSTGRSERGTSTPSGVTPKTV